MTHPEPDARILRGGWCLAEAQFVLAHPAAKWSDHQREAANKALADAVEVFGFPSPEAARLYRCEPLATGYPVPAGNR